MLRFAARHPVHEIHVRKVDTFFMFLLSPSSGPPKFGRGGVRGNDLLDLEQKVKSQMLLFLKIFCDSTCVEVE